MFIAIVMKVIFLKETSRLEEKLTEITHDYVKAPRYLEQELLLSINRHYLSTKMKPFLCIT